MIFLEIIYAGCIIWFATMIKNSIFYCRAEWNRDADRGRKAYLAFLTVFEITMFFTVPIAVRLLPPSIL